MTAATRPADLAVLSARIHTLDPERPSATALAVRDGLIVAVGDRSTVAPFLGPDTVIVDATGQTVTPGLTDSHQHPVMGIDSARGVDLTGAVTIDRLTERLRAHTALLGPHEWVVGRGAEYAAFSGTAIHRDLIDEVVGGRPAFLWFADCHSALAGTAALRLAGVTGPREYADRSEIVCDDRGPTGELHEMTACQDVYAHVPPMDRAELAAGVAELFAAQNRTGITGLHVLDDFPGTSEILADLARTDRLTVRVGLAPWCPPGAVDRLPERIAELRELVTQADQGRGLLTLTAVKFFLDGAIDGGGAWLNEPDCCGQSHASQWKDLTRYEEAVRTAVAHGLPAWTHAIGDRAVGTALRTYAKVGPASGGRHRIEHIELLDDADAARFAELDVVASVQPAHMDWTLPDHSDNWSWRVGPERVGRAWRYGDIARSGGAVALGSDWPITGFDPRPVMAGARLRRPAGTGDRAAILPGQALTAEEALLGYTRAAARAVGREDHAGLLKAGAVADFTAFAADPLTTDPDDLPGLGVTLTVVAGRVTHRAV